MECNKIRREFPDKKFEYCCESCHEDNNRGYGNDLWMTIDGKDRNVCCAIMRAFQPTNTNTNTTETDKCQ